ncbi:P-loop containing nucleoside triphosphate hydrolase protein [Ochromonadaceae sp. CCMP2298]|nr:P-loop containing nucleoside triphosphate hydrolase protein [Ochromonadaceae sp. CCMP2298]
MPPKTSRPPKKGSAKAVKEAAKAGEKGAAAAAAVPGVISELTGDEEVSAADKLRKMGVITTYSHNSKSMHRNVRDIAVSNLTVTFHGAPLVEDAELALNYGNRYAYIGRNGCGKSTFMKVIAARSFPIPEGIDIFHVSEEIEATEMTAKEAVMSVDVERFKLEAEAEQLNDIMAGEGDGQEDTDDIMERLTQVYERLEELDAATAETRASKILTGLGFTKETQHKKTKDFSGGWRMRIALARALFIQPTLLLLDEPTNHLDMEAVVWLEDYLSKWDKILFMVSHSQDFMNNVCTHIVHHTKKRLNYYSGNYDQFCKTREEKEGEQEKRYKTEQDQIKHMKDYVAKFGQGNAKMAKQAQSKEKLLDKFLKAGTTDKVEIEKALDFRFPDPSHLSPPVLQCNDITFGYPGCEILYSHVDFGVDLDSRVALVGPNGAGKSTLLKIMTGELSPITGAVRPHAHLRISKFSQHFLDVLDLTLSPLDYFLALWVDMTREDGRKFLGRYGISGSVQTQVMEQLSDGQKSRVVLAKMAKEAPHLLFLDEPTNHLDMESIDSLAKAINQFSGGMVLVSHDMRLISQVAKEIWLCDNHTVSKYVGEINDFKMQLRRQMELDSEEGGGAGKKAELLIAPLGAKRMLGSDPQVELTIAPLKPESEDEAIRRARMELAELSIRKMRARQEREKAGVVTEADAGEPEEGYETEEQEQARLKAEEKAAAKVKRKAEKEAEAQLNREQEEERVQRKEEKAQEARDAMLLKEQKAKEMVEFLAGKAIRDAKKKAQEDEEEAAEAAAAAQRRADRQALRREKMEQRLLAQENARKNAERAVMEDVWTQSQQVLFETALLDNPSSVDKYERWSRVSLAVGNKTKNQCLMRYRYLKEFVQRKREIESTPIIL